MSAPQKLNSGKLKMINEYKFYVRKYRRRLLKRSIVGLLLGLALITPSTKKYIDYYRAFNQEASAKQYSVLQKELSEIPSPNFVSRKSDTPLSISKNSKYVNQIDKYHEIYTQSQVELKKARNYLEDEIYQIEIDFRNKGIKEPSITLKDKFAYPIGGTLAFCGLSGLMGLLISFQKKI